MYSANSFGKGFVDEGTSSMMKREQAALEKLQRKQQQEIEQVRGVHRDGDDAGVQMIAYEVQMAEIQAKQQEKEERERLRHEKHQVCTYLT